MAFMDLFTFPHFYFILIGALLFSIGVVFVLIHKPKEWYKLHLWFMIAGMTFSVVGIIFLRGLTLIVHGYLGLISGILLLIVILIGFIARYGKVTKKSLRLLHIWGGRVAYLFVFVTLVYGIILFL